MRAVFQSMDIVNKKVSPAALAQHLRDLECFVSESDLQRLMQKYSGGQGPALGFSQFMRMFVSTANLQKPAVPLFVCLLFLLS